MYKQTDKRLNPIAEWGCYFCSILALDEKISGMTYDPPDIHFLWAKNYTEGDLDAESTVLDPQGLCEDLSGELEFVGKFGADYKCKPDEYEILCWYNPRTKFTHFTTGDGAGRCEYDPIENSVTVLEGKVESKRIYRRR